MVSVERIYQYIRQDKAEGGDLYRNCRHRLKHRRRPVGKHIPLRDRVSIDERPASADGTRYGDWEMDTIVGPGNKDAILTLVERSQGYSIIARLPKGKDADGLPRVAYRELLPYMGYIRSITTDNGTEFARHRELAKALGTKIYFTHPYASWEKDLIEYTNKLYRQYIPKGVRFDSYTDQQIKQIQYKINARPRKNSDSRHQYILFSYLCRHSCILELNLRFTSLPTIIRIIFLQIANYFKRIKATIIWKESFLTYYESR